MISIEKNKIIIDGDGQAPEDAAAKAALAELKVAVTELVGMRRFRDVQKRLAEAEAELQQLGATKTRLLSDIEKMAASGENDSDEQRQLQVVSQSREGIEAKVRGLQGTVSDSRQMAHTEATSYCLQQAPRLCRAAQERLDTATRELQEQAEALIPLIASVDALKGHFKAVANLGAKAGASDFLKHLITLPR